MNGIMYLIEGPVGAGKSTYAAQLAAERGGVHLNLDEWMVTLFAADRPEENFMGWYAECKRRLLAQIWRVASSIVAAGHTVVLELGLVDAASREAFYARVDDGNHVLRVTVLDADVDVRRARVIGRNETQGATFRMHVPPEIFELANAAWQPPSVAERQERNIEIVRTDV